MPSPPAPGPRPISCRDMFVATIGLSTLLLAADALRVTPATPGIGRTTPTDIVATEGTNLSETDDVEDSQEHDLHPTACGTATSRWSPPTRGMAIEPAIRPGIAGRRTAATSIRGPPRPA